jgi:hypothetical protein
MRLLVKRYHEELYCWLCRVLDGDMVGKEIFVDLQVSVYLPFEAVAEGSTVAVESIMPFCYTSEGATIVS